MQDELGLNMYDFGWRNYMPDIGRWGNMDNKSEKYYSFSPYNYCINNPLSVIDPDGNEIIFVTGEGENQKQYYYKNGNFYDKETNKRYRYNSKEANTSLNILLKTYREIVKSGDKTLNKLLSTLETSENTHYIRESVEGENGNFVSPISDPTKLRTEDTEKQLKKDIKDGKGVDTQTAFDFSKYKQEEFKKSEGVGNSYFTTISHEMQHQYDFDQGKMSKDYGKGSNAENPAEVRAVKTENIARKIKGMQQRTTYGGIKIKF